MGQEVRVAISEGQQSHPPQDTHRRETEASRLHQQARQAGSRGEYAAALALLGQARALAPGWPYPVYDAAFTHLLQGQTRQAEDLYAQVDQMAPRGFFTCKRALDALRREHAGELFPGFSRGYAMLDWRDPADKTRLLTQVTRGYPAFAPAWQELAYLLEDDQSRLHAIERGLDADPDPDTKGLLLISRAAILARHGHRDTAIGMLGELALSPDSTLLTEHMATAMLGLLTARPAPPAE